MPDPLSFKNIKSLDLCPVIYLVNLDNNLALGWNGTGLSQSISSRTDAQRWYFWADGSGSFILTNKANELALTAGTEVQLAPYSRVTTQRWTVEALSIDA